MPFKILITATDNFNNYDKGDIVSLIPEGGDFGNKETLPDFIRGTISDATQQEGLAYLTNWNAAFDYTIQVENAQGYRILIEADPAAVSASGKGADVKQELKDFILSGLGLNLIVTPHAQTANSITVDVEKPADLAAAKQELNGLFNEVIEVSRYYFDAATVDAAISAGGAITRTKAQAAALLRDKLED